MKGKEKMLIKANNYSITPRRVIAGTKGSYGIETLEFTFSAEWNGLTKRVTFYPVDGDPVSVLYEDEPIIIPAEVTANAGVAQFTLSGVRDGVILISVTGYLDVLDSNDPVGDPAVQPTPSDVSRIIALMNEAVTSVNNLRDDIEDGVFDGVGGGQTGADGVSPRITVTPITGGNRITIFDAENPDGQSFNVFDGENGIDGVSPSMAVTSITGGHRVTITDAAHPSGQSFDVLDGAGGSDSEIDIVDLTENSSYHKGKISVVPQHDTINISEDFDNFDYRARLDFTNGKIVIEHYYPVGQWTTDKEVTNGFVFSDDVYASYGHRPSVAWAFNGVCDYLPVLVDDVDYLYWEQEDYIPYKCVADGNFVLRLLNYLLPDFDTGDE